MGRGANITEPLNPAAIPPAADSGSGHSPVSAAASIPADVMEAAAALRSAVIWQSNASNEVIAEALMAQRAIERERCALEVSAVGSDADPQLAEWLAAAIRRGRP